MTKAWRTLPALLLATTLHAMVLTGMVRWHGSEGAGVAAAPTDVTLTVQPRMSVRLAPTHATSPPALAPADATEPDTTEPIDDRTAAPEPPEVAEAPAPTGGEPDMAPTPLATPNSEAEPDRYHARKELTTPPKALSPIDIVFPPGVPSPGRQTAVLAVYIDELGQVRKVRTEGEALPLAFEDAARNAFLSAHFRPGELAGKKVKSFILVEVMFDEQPQAQGLSVSALGREAH